jgi:hypothetical protein
MWAGVDVVRRAWSFEFLGLLNKEASKQLSGWCKFFLTLKGVQRPAVVALYYETGAHRVKECEPTNEAGAALRPSVLKDGSVGACLTQVSGSVAAQVHQLVINFFPLFQTSTGLSP